MSVGCLSRRAVRRLAVGLFFIAAANAARGGEFRDTLGHTISWEMPPARIVSLSPSLTEILFAVGCDSAVAGVTRFCNYPPSAAALPKVGGIVDASLEAVVMLEPDLVLVTRGNPREQMTSLENLGIAIYAVETRGDLARIIETVREVGAVTGREAAASRLAGELRGRLDAVERRAAALSPEVRPRVYMGELEGAHWTAGPGSYAHALIEAAGGNNVGAVAPAPWSPLSLETIIAGDPEVYLGTFGGSAGLAEPAAREQALEILLTRDGWRGTALARDPRVFLVLEDRLQRPGPRVFDVLEEFARFLHPDLWPEPGAEGGQ